MPRVTSLERRVIDALARLRRSSAMHAAACRTEAQPSPFAAPAVVDVQDAAQPRERRTSSANPIAASDGPAGPDL
jgi:hypothetical protein